jgi:LAO/AO transport system kinase
VYCVNKGDLPGADRTVANLKTMLGLGMRGREIDWMPPVLVTVATSGDGIAELAAAIDAHREYLRAGPGWENRERLRAHAELRRRLTATMVDRLLDHAGPEQVGDLLDRLVARRIDPARAVAELVEAADSGR